MIDKTKIENLTKDLILKYVKRGSAAKSFPKIITAEGIKIKEIEENNSFIGALVKQPTNIFYIYLNKAIQNEGRKNFTLAHELGHYFLKHYLQTGSVYCEDNDINEEGEDNSAQEVEANYFASFLLLPKEKLEKQFKQYKWNIDKNRIFNLVVTPKGNDYKNWKILSSKLTKYFKVSETALRIRLINLGLLEWKC